MVCVARRVIACACVCELPAGRGDRGGGVIIALWMVWNKVSLLSAWSQTEMLMQMVFTPHPSVWYNDSPTNSMYEETERRRCINKNSAHLCENDFSLPSGNLRHTFTLSLRASSISHFSWYFYFYFLSFDNTQSRDFCEEKYSCEKKEWRWVFRKDLALDRECQSHFQQPHKIKVFSTHKMRCVCIGYRVQESKASPWEDTDIFQHIVKSWTANWMTLVRFSNAGWIVAEENVKSLKPLFVF